ncbi:MAG: hypothetical protein AAF602_31110, partial [Myxococcota bacterium]
APSPRRARGWETRRWRWPWCGPTARLRQEGHALPALALCMTRSAWWFGSLETMMRRLLEAIEYVPDNVVLWHQAGLFASRTRTRGEAADYLRRAIEIGEDAGNPPIQIAVFRQHLAVFLAREDEHEAADRLFEQAHADCPRGSRAELAVLSNWTVSLAARALPRAVEVGELALQLAQAGDDELTEANVLHNVAKAYLAVDRTEDAHRALERALDLARRHGSARESLILCLLGVLKARTDPDEAIATLDDAVRAADRTGEPRILAESNARLAQLHLAAGAIGEAYHAIEVAECFQASATAPVRRIIAEVRRSLRES